MTDPQVLAQVEAFARPFCEQDPEDPGLWKNHVQACSMAAETQQCPICSKPVKPYPRYLRYLCRECAAKATSPDGRALRFSNEDASGGFVAEYADTGEPYLGHECFVNGVKCYADEARFGGVVIEAMA